MKQTFVVTLTLATALLSLATSSLLHADWESEIRVKSGSRPEVKGTAHFKNPKMRLDLTQGGNPTSIIVDWKGKTALILLPAQKMLMNSDLSHVQTKMVSCDGNDFGACLLRDGYKKSGTETANGHECTVYEKNETTPQGKKLHLKLWRPNDIQEPAVARSANYDEGGKLLTQADFVGIRSANQPAALFVAPSDYKALSLPPGLTLDPDKMREMHRRQGGTPSTGQ